MSDRKPIEPIDRLIVALDVPSRAEAEKLVSELGDTVSFYKIGMELFAAGEGRALAESLANSGKKVFVDLKFFDVPATVGRAMARLADSGATFATVHGNDAILEAAVASADSVGVLAVTALTSLDEGDLKDLGFSCAAHELVLSRAKRALALGCTGVVSSGLEVRALREGTGDALVAVVPGIRPVANREEDDQKRVATVESALADGADYLVVGRPIRDAADRQAAAADIQRRIALATA